MMNPFVIKKYAALIMAAFIPTICFYVGIIYYNLWIALGIFFGGLIVSVIIGVMFLSNPFTSLLEGKGIIAFDFTSTGIINPFIVNVTQKRGENPKVTGKIGGRQIQDIFDRNAVWNLSTPRKIGTALITNPAPTPKDYMSIQITEEEYNKARFAMAHMPVLLYNSQIGSFVTKDFLSGNEKEAFAEHTILYLTKVTEDLTSATRDFGRYVVDTLKPKMDIFGSKWLWIIVAVVAIILIAMFAPSIIKAIKGVTSSAGDTIGATLATGQTVTPLQQIG